MYSRRGVNWRESYDYRAEYFKKNTGLLGYIWFCSQCAKPLWGKNSVQVDHIVPPSAFSRKKRNRRGEVVSNTSFLARALNSSFNTVAICPACNLKKSNKMGVYVAKGTVAKTREVVESSVQKLIGFILYGAARVVWIGIKLIISPLRGRVSPLVKLTFVVLYIVIILSFMRR